MSVSGVVDRTSSTAAAISCVFILGRHNITRHLYHLALPDTVLQPRSAPVYAPFKIFDFPVVYFFVPPTTLGPAETGTKSYSSEPSRGSVRFQYSVEASNGLN